MTSSNIKPALLIHAGMSDLQDPGPDTAKFAKELARIADDGYEYLQTHNAVDSVVYIVKLLEDCPLFNAGTGSKLQIDGKARMSAALMDGSRGRFCGVVDVENVKNPVEVAFLLLETDDRILCSGGAKRFARDERFRNYNPVTEASLAEWKAGMRARKEGNLTFRSSMDRTGSVGVVLLDVHGNLAAGTSTGGKSLETVGRVSEASMPCGTYANDTLAFSCTGVGEDLIDLSFGSRIMTRVLDGLSLKDALAKSLTEAKKLNKTVGSVIMDNKGRVAFGHTGKGLYFAYNTGKGTTKTFADKPSPSDAK